MQNENTIASIRPSGGSLLGGISLVAAARAGAFSSADTSEHRVSLRSNVVAEDAHVSAMSEAISTVARIVGRTLGPHGSNSLVLDQNGAHFATKDGYTVLTRMTFVQDTANMVLDHVRSVSRSMVRKVGDGSTSAVIMANSLYQNVLSYGLTDVFAPGVVQSALNVLAQVIGERISKAARPVTNIADIGMVATISGNNNPWVGKIISEAYELGGEHANITVLTGGEQTTVESVKGYRVARGMVNECFATDSTIDGVNKTVARHSNAKVMVVDDYIDQALFANLVATIMNDTIASGAPFVLVAKEYGTDVLKIVRDFVQRSPGVRILLIDHASSTRRGAARLGDLAAALECSVSNRETVPSAVRLGFTNMVYSTMSETVFTLPTISKSAQERANELMAQHARLDANSHDETMREDLNELLLRARALCGSEVTINTGGTTEQEKQALMYLLDDAALAAAAAKASGIVEGLGLTGLRDIATNMDEIVDVAKERLREFSMVSDELNEELLKQCAYAITEAYKDAAKCVLTNARVGNVEEVINRCIQDDLSYNALSQQFVSKSETLVVNPAATDIEVLRGAMSIVALLLTSNQTLLTRPSVDGGLD